LSCQPSPNRVDDCIDFASSRRKLTRLPKSRNRCFGCVCPFVSFVAPHEEAAMPLTNSRRRWFSPSSLFRNAFQLERKVRAGAKPALSAPLELEALEDRVLLDGNSLLLAHRGDFIAGVDKYFSAVENRLTVSFFHQKIPVIGD